MTSDREFFSESLTFAAQTILDTLYKQAARWGEPRALDYFSARQAALVEKLTGSTDDKSATFQAAYTTLVGSYIAYGIYEFVKERGVLIDAKLLSRDDASEREVDLSDWGN